MPPLKVRVALESDIGLVRERNEDLVLASPLAGGEVFHQGLRSMEVAPGEALLLAVLDGMGGTLAGDRASELAGEVLAREVEVANAGTREALGEALVHGMIEANAAVRREGRAEASRRGMGTTLTAAGVVDDHLLVAHVGDSRAYLLRGGRLIQITEDQSLSRPELYRGDGPEERGQGMAHSNVVLQALGIAEYLDPFMASIALAEGDLLFLCSDGISAQIPGEEIRLVLDQAGEDLPGAAAELTARARAAGGQDNASVLLARFGGGGLASGLGGEAPVEAEALLPSGLVRHLRRRLVVQVLQAVGVLVVLFALLLGLILLVQG